MKDRFIEKPTNKKAALAATLRMGGTTMAGQVTPTDLAKKVAVTPTSSQQQQSPLQREQQHEHLARLVAKHQQQKQHLRSLVQQQALAAQQQNVQSLLLLQQLVAAQQQQQQQQQQQIFQHSSMTFAPILSGLASVAAGTTNTAGLSPYQQPAAFAALAAADSLNSLQGMLTMRLAPMHGCALVFPVISMAGVAQVAHSQAVAPHGAQQAVTHQRVLARTAAAATGRDPAAKKPTAALAKFTFKDKIVERSVLERKMPRAVARANRAASIPHGINVIEDDSDEEPAGPCTNTSATKQQTDLTTRKGNCRR